MRLLGSEETLALFRESWHDWKAISGNPFYEFMQFTGLFDKNGKEIFEGDILRLFCGYVKSSPGHSIIATVIWDKDGFRADKLDKTMKVIGGSSNGKILPMREVHSWVGMHTCLREWDDYREVIGNIYENPDLLESQI